eukprot:COSAG01_NODE_8160_length_2897_cov_5.436741_2_plen_116_part_00
MMSGRLYEPSKKPNLLMRWCSPSCSPWLHHHVRTNDSASRTQYVRAVDFIRMQAHTTIHCAESDWHDTDSLRRENHNCVFPFVALTQEVKELSQAGVDLLAAGEVLGAQDVELLL